MVHVAATLTNNRSQVAPMVILDLPVPAGFALVTEDLERLVASQVIAKYQVTSRSAIVYLRELKPASPLRLRYGLRATMPVKLLIPAAQAYEYYDPDVRSESDVSQLEVVDKGS